MIMIIDGCAAWMATRRVPNPILRRHFRATTECQLNRFLLSDEEVHKHMDGQFTATLSKDDYRTIHAAKILGLQNGDTIRAGIVSSPHHSGLLTDTAVIDWIPEGKVKKTEPLGNGNPPGSLRISLSSLQPASDAIQAPPVSLILALPRPLQLGRMLPMIAQMGVDTLVLTAAKKVPKDYFGSHLFRQQYSLTGKLVEGLCQAGDVRLPTVHVVHHLPSFLRHDLDALFPLATHARVVAHPQRPGQPVPIRLRDVNLAAQPPRLVVAVGPEGGWQEPDELELLAERGFQQVTMGERVLRSDCAVVSLLSLAHDVCHAKDRSHR